MEIENEKYVTEKDGLNGLSYKYYKKLFSADA